MKRGIKKGLTALIFTILLTSFVSSEIIFTQSLKSSYNLGDEVNLPITISSLSDVSGNLVINLICNGTSINLLTWNGLNLRTGYPKVIPYSFALAKNTIGGSSGTCNIQVTFGSDLKVSDDFKISNLLSISGVMQKSVFDSGETVPISGKVTRETGENANGFIDANIVTNDINQNITQSGTVTDGIFAMNISLPSNLKAGNYLVNLNAYEEDSDGLQTNMGNVQYNISINQVPTNLELIIDNKEINPGESITAHAILHDQTGDPINTTIFLTLKDSNDKIIEQKEVNTGELFTYPITFNEPPATWKIFAASNQLNSEENFMIKTKESVDIQIINKTILVTNNGNVPYNKTLLVKIGDTPLNVNVELGLGESKKYALTAPDGEYAVRIVGNPDNEVTGTMSLTGNAIGIREASSWTSLGIIIAWTFLISVLAVGAFFGFKKIRKKPFFGRMNLGKNSSSSREVPVLKNNSVTAPGKKAEMSLSVNGDKQDATVICLKIKNMEEVKSRRGSASDAIQKITELAEENNAVTYDNQNYLFFIFAPAKTRTFKNEESALNLAENIQKMLTEHNRMFNQKMDFGISLEDGTIIAKIENGIFKFMSLGSLITSAKKIASLSNEEVLLSTKINDLVRVHAKTEKEIRDGTSVFILGTIKKEDEAAKNFINKFMERQKRGY